MDPMWITPWVLWSTLITNLIKYSDEAKINYGNIISEVIEALLCSNPDDNHLRPAQLSPDKRTSMGDGQQRRHFREAGGAQQHGQAHEHQGQVPRLRIASRSRARWPARSWAGTASSSPRNMDELRLFTA